MNGTDHDIPAPLQAISILGVAAAIVFSAWTTVIAFVGGTMPIIGWETDGGIVTGLVWIAFVDPIIVTVVYWATLLVVLPLSFLFGHQNQRRG